ncbi:MAG: SMP-30/gluconolactonase/LRE family protein [Verrucomicrobiota bacterium JB023]|nr:SMP-30/gluconolactonase/LRE family protein [Verrucomicrobiota bacterium JB023]
MEISTVGSYRAQWGEGPVWWKGGVYYVDIEGHCVVRWEEGKDEKTWPVAERIGFVTPDEDGTLIIGGDSGLRRLNPDTGFITPIADPEKDLPDNRFNDGKRAPDGRIFAGTISMVKKQGTAALYCFERNGELRKVLDGVTNSNGMAWSKDAKTVYYIDTPRKEIWAFDYDEATGEWSNQRTVVDTSHLDSSPDGMTIDKEDKLLVAFCHGGCVIKFDPATGKELARIDFPCVETTSCCFGEDESELFVTTGIKKDLLEEDAGRLFRVRF